MTEGSKSGPSEVKRYTLRYVPNHEPEQRMYDRDGMRAPSKSEFVLASDYDSLRTQLSAVEAERDRIRRAACEAMALIGELCPIDFKDTDKGEKYAARAHDMLFAALASESSAT